MELVSLLSVFRRRRLVLALGLVIATAVGAVAGGVVSSGSRGSPAAPAAATARVLVDTRVPQIATTRAVGQDTIVQQAVFLAVRMNRDATSATIAKASGIPRDALTVVVPVLPPLEELSLVPDGQLPTLAAKDTQIPRTPYVVSLYPSYTVPIINIDTAAPNGGAAVKLARATVAAMQLATQPKAGMGSPAAATQPPALRVAPLGAPTVAPQVSVGTHLRRGVAAMVALLFVWCVGMVIVSGVRRLWLGAAGTIVAGGA